MKISDNHIFLILKMMHDCPACKVTSLIWIHNRTDKKQGSGSFFLD